MPKPETPRADDNAVLIRRLADAVPSMLAYWDTEQRCRFANQAYKAWFGISPLDLLGKHMSELLGQIYPLNLPYIMGALRGEPQQFDREIPDPTGGPPRYSQANYVPDVIDGRVRGFFVMVTDISERRRLECALREARDEAQAIATHDHLTGLPNRVLLDDRLESAVELARRRKGRCAVFFIDLDRFKRINDSQGHAAGDELLCAVARRVSGALRQVDTLARLGGDEFIALLPQIETRQQTEVVARKVLSVTSGAPFAIAQQALEVTLSVGIALFPDDGDSPRELLAHADGALYAAKQAGRNAYSFGSGRDPAVQVDGRRRDLS
jgi:diguanylate cyclase (GGDEF)-like protein/PAS domain S-box-containing protein